MRFISDWSVKWLLIYICISSEYSLCFNWRISIASCSFLISSLIKSSSLRCRMIVSEDGNIRKSLVKSYLVAYIPLHDQIIGKWYEYKNRPLYQDSYWPSSDRLSRRDNSKASVWALWSLMVSSKYFIKSIVDECRAESAASTYLIVPLSPMFSIGPDSRSIQRNVSSGEHDATGPKRINKRKSSLERFKSNLFSTIARWADKSSPKELWLNLWSALHDLKLLDHQQNHQLVLQG